MSEHDPELRAILEDLLANDKDITARAVARLHPRINAASSITRSKTRSALLADYQERQREYRAWRGRVGKLSSREAAAALVKKDLRIAELEQSVQVLTSSHVALLRTVGAMGGFSKWAQFFEKHQEIRQKLEHGQSASDGTPPMHDDLPEKKLQGST